MRIIVQPLKLIEILSFVWTGMKLFISECYHYYYREETVIKIKSGLVKGFKISSSFDYKYYNFIGIPYAKPPVGDLRFKDPQPFEPSNGVINEECGRYGSMACQADLMTQIPIGKENCLHLSVFTCDIKPTQLKPVMVWIHGGAFNFGSSMKIHFNPEFLLRKDIVVISINYRLGAFGFLSLKDPALGVPGNAGLKDQVMALKWIKENCMHFGGDPDNITIFGESAGAASASMHMVSDKSIGLFHKAIMMSGNSYARWCFPSYNNWGEKLAKRLGWNGDGGESACLAVLKKASPRSIVKMQEELTTLQDRKKYDSIPFSPVIEAYESEQCFLSKYPKDIMNSAWSKHIPVIVGLCTNDSYVFTKMIKKHPEIANENNLNALLSFMELGINTDSEECIELSKQLKHFYFDRSMANTNPIFIHLKTLHDKGFAHPTHQLIMDRNSYQHGPTYLLRFDFESTYSLSRKLFIDKTFPGACHGDDCSYYFRTVSSGPDPAADTDEWKTIERMCDIYSTFARSGDPNNKSIAPIQWEPVETTDKNPYKYKCLNLSKKVSYIDWPDLDRMKIWDKIYEHLCYSHNKN